MKKATIARLLVLCLIVSMMAMPAAAATESSGAGAGTADDPYKLGSDTYEVTDGVYTITVDAGAYAVFDSAAVSGEGEYKITIGEKSTLTSDNVQIKAGGKLEVYASENSVTPLYSAVNAVDLTDTEVYYYVVAADAQPTPSGRTADATATIGGYIKGSVKLTAKDATFSYMKALDDAELEVTSGVAGWKVNEDRTGSLVICTLKEKTSSSGGGGGGAVTTTVSTPSTTGGRYTVNNTRAKAGDTVTITTTPDPGKKVGSVVVTDKNGKNVPVTDIGNGKYTFVMPDTTVTVKVTFVDEDAPDNVSFTDVPEDAYYYDAVMWAVEKGITVGLTDTTFGPDVSCTRAQMVTFLWRLAGSPKVTSTNPFGDVAADDYYYDAVMWAVSNGVTSGTAADAFSPDATVSRAQSVTFLYRYAGSPEVEASDAFTDVAADDYFADAVAWAADNGITVGTTATTFSPDNACVRAQIVTFMYRYAGEK